MDGYRFFLRNLFKAKKETRKETKPAQQTLWCAINLTNPDYPWKAWQGKDCKLKASRHLSRESTLKRNGHDKCRKRQMVTEGHRQKESRPKIMCSQQFAINHWKGSASRRALTVLSIRSMRCMLVQRWQTLEGLWTGPQSVPGYS